MTNYNLLPFSFPAVLRKQVPAAFDGGRHRSDGGVMLLAMAEQRPGNADRLARGFPGRRDPTRITHTLAEMIRARIFAWLNRCRRFVKGFENLTRNALAFLRLASIRLILRKLCNQ